MGREIRRVPENWEHPKQIKQRLDRGGYKVVEEYRPMYQNATFEEAVKEFEKEVKDWLEGYKHWQEGVYFYGEEKETKEQAIKRWKKDILEEKKRWGFHGDYKEEELQKYQTGICSWSDVAG